MREAGEVGIADMVPNYCKVLYLLGSELLWSKRTKNAASADFSRRKIVARSECCKKNFAEFYPRVNDTMTSILIDLREKIGLE